MRVLAFVLSAPFIELAALFLSILWMLRNPKDKVRPLLVIALIVNLFYGILLSMFMGAEGSLLPWKYDFILLHLDTALGLPATRLAQPLEGEWRIPLMTVYQLMIPMMICWFLVVRRRGLGPALILAYVAELVTGPLLYAIVPACGPGYALGADWMHAAPPAQELIRLGGMPNAFPSLHIGTALVLVLFAPGRWSRIIALAFFAATGMAIVSTGEHYVIDLLPGLAFGCFAAEAGLRRYKPALANLALALLWSFLVRFEYPFFISHPYALRILAFVTVLATATTVAQEWRKREGRGAEDRSGDRGGSAPEQPTPVHMPSP
ncbi:MAG TPA: phosphatase PAP2 family protein [Acidobacteriaceae bacterium]|nr:phosphatase PAP2 family protein [Acidobacteriaceae bacterium]